MQVCAEAAHAYFVLTLPNAHPSQRPEIHTPTSSVKHTTGLTQLGFLDLRKPIYAFNSIMNLEISIICKV